MIPRKLREKAEWHDFARMVAATIEAIEHHEKETTKTTGFAPTSGGSDTTLGRQPQWHEHESRPIIGFAPRL